MANRGEETSAGSMEGVENAGNNNNIKDLFDNDPIEKKKQRQQQHGFKRRLSRKEQKARRKKKQRQRQVRTQSEESRDTALPQQPAPKEEGTTRERTDKKALQREEEQNNEDREDLLSSYIPIPIPKHDEKDVSVHVDSKKSLGKWFPKATVIKSKISPDKTSQSCLVLFYQYVTPPWPESRVRLLHKYLEAIALTRTALGGRIRVAPEGVNATLSAIDFKNVSAPTILEHVCMDLKRFDSVFEQTDFKFIPNLQADRHFKDFKILPVKELVFYGIGEQQAPLSQGGVHLEPREFHKMLAGTSAGKKDTVVVDVRNHYEAAIGRFDGQQVQAAATGDKSSAGETAAEYIDPRMRKSTDFASWLQQPQIQEKLKNKKVLMFCTGGVRCERASAYLNTQMGSSLKGIYQLQGGIERYLQTYKDGGFWRGKNYVFDKREAISANNYNGDGGVLKKNPSSNNGIESTVCCVCDKPWDRYVGKQKCDTCGVPVLMCDTCIQASKQYKKQQQPKKVQENNNKFDLVRCPLCVEEGITVRASQLEYTNNGVINKVVDNNNGGGSRGNNTNKAAPSVLKWGGGHAKQKKEKRRFQNTPCRFGAECVRKDCFFAHPERVNYKKSKS